MFEKQRAWVRRVNKLLEFMHYEWGKDEKWLKYSISKGNQDIELLKRGYYSS
jgi:hypothetical protein